MELTLYAAMNFRRVRVAQMCLMLNDVILTLSYMFRPERTVICLYINKIKLLQIGLLFYTCFV